MPGAAQDPRDRSTESKHLEPPRLSADQLLCVRMGGNPLKMSPTTAESGDPLTVEDPDKGASLRSVYRRQVQISTLVIGTGGDGSLRRCDGTLWQGPLTAEQISGVCAAFNGQLNQRGEIYLPTKDGVWRDSMELRTLRTRVQNVIRDSEK